MYFTFIIHTCEHSTRAKVDYNGSRKDIEAVAVTVLVQTPKLATTVLVLELGNTAKYSSVALKLV